MSPSRAHASSRRITTTTAARQGPVSPTRDAETSAGDTRLPACIATTKAQHQSAALGSIRDYVTGAWQLHDSPLDFDASDTEARLAETVKELQARIQEQQAALDKVRQRADTVL